MTYLIPLALFIALCAAVYHSNAQTRKAIQDDSEASQALYRKRDAEKVAKLRHEREASRRHYEGITYPAMVWEYRKREILGRIA